MNEVYDILLKYKNPLTISKIGELLPGKPLGFISKSLWKMYFAGKVERIIIRRVVYWKISA
jgi:hypothetical protein